MKSEIILIGGFLGAGKTTLLWKVAEYFTNKGLKVGLITNDQASELVDTAFLAKSGGITTEVSGSCFCCNFNGFTSAIKSLKEQNQTEVIIAEPVGSCTDLSATIMQPLKEHFHNDLILRPLNVLIDPNRLASLLDGGTAGLHESSAYIIRKQLEEADNILINKIDLLTEQELNEITERTKKQWPQAKVYALSGQDGTGVKEWLQDLQSTETAGNHLLDIDYDVYAEGEAVLGWLNATILLESDATDWQDFSQKILHYLANEFNIRHSEVGHVKLILEDNHGYILGNLTGKKDSIVIRGSIENTNQVRLTLNARVELPPEELEKIVLKTMNENTNPDLRYSILALKCLQPGRPNPTHRYSKVV